MLVRYFWIDRQNREHGCYQCDMQDFRSWLSHMTTKSIMYVVVEVPELLAINYYFGMPNDITNRLVWQQVQGERAQQFFSNKFLKSISH